MILVDTNLTSTVLFESLFWGFKLRMPYSGGRTSMTPVPCEEPVARVHDSQPPLQCELVEMLLPFIGLPHWGFPQKCGIPKTSQKPYRLSYTMAYRVDDWMIRGYPRLRNTDMCGRSWSKRKAVKSSLARVVSPNGWANHHVNNGYFWQIVTTNY